MTLNRRAFIKRVATLSAAVVLPIGSASAARALVNIQENTGFATIADWNRQYETRWGPLGKQPLSAVQSVIHAKNGVYDDQYGPFAWIVHYWLRAWAKLANATGNEIYLHTGMSFIDFMLDHTDERRVQRGEIRENYLREPLGLQGTGRGGPFWKRWEEVNVLNTGMVAHGIMRFVDIVLENRDRWPAYALIAERYLEQLKPAIDAFDSDWKDFGDAGSYYYRDSGGTNVLGNTEVSFNQAATMCAANLLVNKWDPDPQRMEKARRLVNYWVNDHVTFMANGAIRWPYRLSSDDPDDQIEDTGHATVDLDFLIMAHEAGISEMTSKHVDGLVNTFTKNIWRSDGSLNEFVNGNTSENFSDFYNAGFSWFDLAKYKPEIVQMAYKTYSKFYHDQTAPGQLWARPMLGWVNLLQAAKV